MPGNSAVTDLALAPLLTTASVNGGASKPRIQHRINFTTKWRKMSRRANLIGICGVTSLCILLLIATAQHRPLPTMLAASSGTVGGPGGLGAERHLAYNVLPPNAYNLSASAQDVLAAKRSRIVTEMENFEYPSGRFGVDAEKLADLTPETGGTPVRSIIITSWRSGSTFLGDILNAMPGNFYHYEPLLHLGIRRFRGGGKTGDALKAIKDLLYCDYSDMSDYLDFGKSHVYLFEHNERLWSVCKEYPHFCWLPKFLTPFCKLFPMQSMKLVRLSLAPAEQLLEDQGLNARIVLLVRDPRGTLQSRRHRDWCSGVNDCDNPKVLCDDLVSDFKTAEYLLKKYPNHFRTLRYEDLSLNPYEMTQEVFQFYGLPFDPLVEEFLDTHTKKNIGGVSSTYRDSRSAPFHWKQDLKIEEIRNIQDHCRQAMDLWGYRRIDNFTDFQLSFDPIKLPPPLS